MLKIKYSLEAYKDLKSLKKYLSSNWGENKSKKIIKKIASDIRSLEKFPKSGAKLSKIIGFDTDYRYLFTEKNYVFYYLDKEIINIVRIINEKQDFINKLFWYIIRYK